MSEIGNELPNAKKQRTESPKVQTDREKYAPYFEELVDKGYTVIPDVVSPEKCAEASRLLHEFMLKLDIDITSPSLKKSDYPNAHGIIQHLGAGQSQGAWLIRQDEEVANIFGLMYGTNDLLCSMDGVCLVPSQYTNRNKSWLHVDQAPTKKGLRCIQGYVNLLTSHDAKSRSLSVVPCSHLAHEKLEARIPRAQGVKKDWFKFEENELCFLGGSARDHDGKLRRLAPLQRTRVLGGVGSLVLWDSRLAHEGLEPDPDIKDRRPGEVVYVSMQPRAFISDANLEKKKKAFREYRLTTHYAASKIELFPLKWRTWGKEVPENLTRQIRDRVESPRMLELAGITELKTRAKITTEPMLDFGAEKEEEGEEGEEDVSEEDAADF